MSRSVLLLRAVNVAGRNRVPMPRLREALATQAGMTDATTYIASGNIICAQPEDADALCSEVRRLIAAEFAVDTPVIHRTHRELVASLARQPFEDRAEKLVHAMFLEAVPAEDAVAALEPRLVPGERIELIGRDLWIAYSESGSRGTRLTGSVLDRALGVAGTARNLRTVRALVDMTK